MKPPCVNTTPSHAENMYDFRQRQASNPRYSVWVTANAGSGKTKVLSDRVLALLVSGARPSAILCMTYTKAAAGEMANRIYDRLAKWAIMDQETLAGEIDSLDDGPVNDAQIERARKLFATVLDIPGGLRIQTLHSFCQSVLGRFSVEAGISPRFEVLDDLSAVDYLETAQNTVLNLATKAHNNDPLREGIETIASSLQENDFSRLMGNLVRDRQKISRYLQAHGRDIHQAVAHIYKYLGCLSSETPEDITAKACMQSAADWDNIRNFWRVMLEEGSETQQKKAQEILDWLVSPVERRALSFLQYVEWHIDLKDGRAKAKKPKKSILEKHPWMEDVLVREQNRLGDIHYKYKAAVTAQKTAALLHVGHAIEDTYRKLKQATARLDYDDLIERTLTLLRQEDITPWVHFKLDGGIDHILVDEGQDTSADQREIINILSSAFFDPLPDDSDSAISQEPDLKNKETEKIPRTVFIVGDDKQSIFGFQGADLDGFRAWRDKLEQHVGLSGQSLRDISMETSFRSTQAVLDVVDGTFASHEQTRGVNAGKKIRHHAARKGQAGEIALWPVVPQPEKGDESDPWTPCIAEEKSVTGDMGTRLAVTIAERIADMVDREMLPARNRTIQSGDIMILLRRRSHFMEKLVKALKSKGIAVAGSDRMRLNEQLVVMDLKALGHFLLLPEDDLTLACVLKSPFIGFDDDDLLNIAIERQGASLWQALRQRAKNDFPCYQLAVKWLESLLSLVDMLPVFELYQHVLTRPCPLLAHTKNQNRNEEKNFQKSYTGHQAIMARLGTQAEDPMEEFLTLALDYNRLRISSLQGFLHHLSRSETEIKRDFEASQRDEVRIMTVHGAKGLQAPIVILPDTFPEKMPLKRIFWEHDDSGGADIPFWFINKDHELPGLSDRLKEEEREKGNLEAQRLLYVALTRAEDRLIICGYDSKRNREKAQTEAPEQKTQTPQSWYMLVKAGMERLGESVTEVDFNTGQGWTGKSQIYLTKQEDKVDPPTVKAQETAAPPPESWLYHPPKQEPANENITQAISSSQLEKPVLTPSGKIVTPPVRSPLDDPKAMWFKRGRLTHRLLELLPEIPHENREKALLHYLSRSSHALNQSMRREIAQEVMAIFNHPGFQELFGPKSRAEVPLAGYARLKPGYPQEIIKGQVDRLLVRRDDILMVDYKTLRPPPDDPGHIPKAYLYQMAAYRALLKKIWPGRNVHCALIWTQTATLMPVEDALMDEEVNRIYHKSS